MNALLSRLLGRFPRLKSQLRQLRNQYGAAASVSTEYVEIDRSRREDESRRLADSWKQDELPQRQRALADLQLQKYRNGAKIDVYDTFIEALDAAQGLPAGASLLEIGCSSGYYSEVLKIAGKDMIYTGCDYSDAFIALGRSIYPDLRLDVEDATRLSYADETFDVVVSGCCLLHIPDYRTAIAETARVARSHVVFHRTPVVYGQDTRYYRKKAYGVETIEIHLSETEFMELLAEHGLSLIKTITLSDTPDPQNPSIGGATRTYLCRKIA